MRGGIPLLSIALGVAMTGTAAGQGRPAPAARADSIPLHLPDLGSADAAVAAFRAEQRTGASRDTAVRRAETPIGPPTPAAHAPGATTPTAPSDNTPPTAAATPPAPATPPATATPPDTPTPAAARAPAIQLAAIAFASGIAGAIVFAAGLVTGWRLGGPRALPLNPAERGSGTRDAGTHHPSVTTMIPRKRFARARPGDRTPPDGVSRPSGTRVN